MTCSERDSAALLWEEEGPLSRSPCELLPVGTGHPVQAVLKSFTVMSGCASRGTVSLPQEVHVINLRGHAAEGPDSAPAKISLVLLFTLTSHHLTVEPRLVFRSHAAEPMQELRIVRHTLLMNHV
ncbi:hypothetical protein ILYODFUR_004715 [Ilyodon furcidens]|uniref:TGFBR3/Endoglin-like N-terminal domain-containing protein n=1 Tax=Ilyodon furcidens TaxID=33524 RepID=A0ABV0SIH9_9TELE